MKAILENIHREDRLQAAKQVGVGENVTVTYRASQGGKRKRKWRRTSSEANDPQGPPDSSKAVQRKTGAPEKEESNAEPSKKKKCGPQRLVGRRVNVELEDENEGYPGWFIGSILRYLCGSYKITFHGNDDSHNIWLAKEDVPNATLNCCKR
ncbi:hypothetical protein ACROYT_G015120 [Oculina patagonica]